MLNFCTFFDKNYLSKGLALFESLNRYCEEINIYVLCLDDFTLNYLNQTSIKNVVPIPLLELEKFDEELLASKNNRTLIEYYFTISPCLPLYLLKKERKLKWICSLDADIYFYDNPKPIFDDFEDKYSILITPHKFAKELLKLGIEKYGIYNVSFQAFRNNKIGLACLEKWRKQCIDWCKYQYDEEKKRYADQKYLDTWLMDFPNEVKVLDDSVCGLAVWNVNNYDLELRNNQLFSNKKRLIFYHFHQLNIINKYWIGNGFVAYNVHKSKCLDNAIYKPYINLISDFNVEILIQKEKTVLSKTMLSKIINNPNLFFQLNKKKLIRVNTRLILNSYIFLKKNIYIKKLKLICLYSQ